jgi:hypothetical protein
VCINIHTYIHIYIYIYVYIYIYIYIWHPSLSECMKPGKKRQFMMGSQSEWNANLSCLSGGNCVMTRDSLSLRYSSQPSGCYHDRDCDHACDRDHTCGRERDRDSTGAIVFVENEKSGY